MGRTWVALCADTKLAASWLVGGRDGETAKVFVADLAGRLRHRAQLTSDGHKPYLEAVEAAFGADVVAMGAGAPSFERPNSPARLAARAAGGTRGGQLRPVRVEVAPGVRPVRLTPGRVAWLRDDPDEWPDGRRAYSTSQAMRGTDVLVP